MNSEVFQKKYRHRSERFKKEVRALLDEYAKSEGYAKGTTLIGTEIIDGKRVVWEAEIMHVATSVSAATGFPFIAYTLQLTALMPGDAQKPAAFRLFHEQAAKCKVKH